MVWRQRAVARRAAGVALVLWLLGTMGCGAKSGGSSGLSPAATRSAAMDGFVFVPSRSRDRQTATGTVSIPFAIIKIYS